MEPRLSLVTLGVRDLERALGFYRDGLGWRPSSASTQETIFFDLNGLVLTLWPRHLLAEDARLPEAGSGFAGFTLAHNVASQAEVDSTLEQARAAGATILKPGTAAEWGGYSGYFADPDGFAWEVAWNPFFPLQPDGRVSLPA